MKRSKLVWVGALVVVLLAGLWLAGKSPAPRDSSPRVAPRLAETEPVHVSDVAPFGLQVPQGDAATARDVVEVAAGAAAEDTEEAPAAPDRLHWQARLRLLDGSPLPSTRFVALVSGASAELARVDWSVDPQPPEILARGDSNDNGLLTLAFSGDAAHYRGIDLYAVSDPRIEPNPQSLDLSGPQPAELVYRGGTVHVLVLDSEGEPAPWARVIARWAEPSTGRPWIPTNTGFGSEPGRARLVFFDRSAGEIAAFGRNGVARIENVQFEPSSVQDDVTLVLGQEGLTGRLHVDVVSREGVPVRDFGVRITGLSLPGFVRYVDSAKIGPEGFVDGLPLGLVRVAVAGTLREPPHIFRDEGIPPLEVELHADRVAGLRFTVPLAARWRLELLASEIASVPVRFYSRRADQEGSEWEPHGGAVWQFGPVSATVGKPPADPGIYYSDLLDPGIYEFELRRGGEEAFWRTTATLVAGEIARLTAQL